MNRVRLGENLRRFREWSIGRFVLVLYRWEKPGRPVPVPLSDDEVTPVLPVLQPSVD